MTSDSLLTVHNGEAVSWRDLPLLDPQQFRESLIRQVEKGGRIVSLFGVPLERGDVRLFAAIARDTSGEIVLLSTDVGDVYPALTPDCPQAHWFEREIAEQWGILPQGHPWLKPIRFHAAYRKGHDVWSRNPDEKIIPGDTTFYRVEGEEIHEVAVGPVHAGIIEPGHFRFQCHGEIVFHLEISLGYQHRGVEQALIGAPNKRSLPYMETLAGDTTIGHTLAYCQALESLSGTLVPQRAEVLRAVALELERLANHAGDLGALATDIGFLPTASFCGRIRGDFLNMTAMLCGNRFGRGLVRPGGVGFDAEASRIEELQERLATTYRDLEGAAHLLWQTASVRARFEDTGALTPADCNQLGLVGVAARACGIERDVRHQFPFGAYRFTSVPVSTWQTGDVFARAYVRWMEAQRSVQFIEEQLRHLPAGDIRTPINSLAPECILVSLTEGWRGEICHVALTDPEGSFVQYKIVDPSFHNWMGLALALRNEQISDFPLCNKSFNLSYCGHDL